MIIVRELDHSAVTDKSRTPIHSKIALQVSESFKHPIFSCWFLP